MKQLILILISIFTTTTAWTQVLTLDEPASFHFESSEALGSNLLGFTGQLSWNHTLFEYDSVVVDKKFKGVLLNEMYSGSQGYIRFSWATDVPITNPDSAIVTLYLRPKSLGSYNILGDFWVNEDTSFSRLYTGTIGTRLSNHEDTDGTSTSFRVYPNPAYEYVNITYTTATPQHVSIKLYNVLGQEVKQYYQGFVYDSVIFRYTTDGIKSGLYFYTIRTNTSRITWPITIIR